MKVALLCAIVFGAISVAASSSQHVADEHRVQHSAGHRPKASTKNKGSAKKQSAASHHLHEKHERGKASKPPHAEHLIKRAEPPVAGIADIGENIAGVLKHAMGGGERSSGAINRYGASAVEHVPVGTAHPYYPPPAYGHDVANAASLAKINSKLDKLKDGHKINSQQIEMMQELQAKQMANTENAAAAAAKSKPGTSWGKMAMMGIGGIGLGYGATKLFDTKPSDSTTGYSQQDKAALQGGGAAPPGSALVDGAGGTAGGQGGQGGDRGFDGPFTIPNSKLVWIVDRSNQVHVLDPAQNYAEVPAPPGWQPPGATTAVLASDGSAGTGSGSDAGAGSVAGAGAVGTGAAGAGAGAAGGAGSADGASTAQAADGSVSSGADQGVGGQATQGGKDAKYQQAAQDSGAATGQGDASSKPVYDKAIGMYYVVGPQGVKYYLDPQSRLLINSETMDASDPKTGKIIYSGKDLENGSAGGDGGAAGPGTAGPGQGQAQGGSGGSTAGAGGNSAGAGAGRSTGGMQKRSLRRRKLDKRSYGTIATQATNPALRAQAQIAMLRESGGSAAATAAKGGWGKTVSKFGLGAAGLAALVIGLGEYAHPKLPNTTEDNEYGLTPTNVCDIYGEPIIMDFKGRLWNKSTYTQVDLNNPPPLHQCSRQELADNDVAPAGPAGAGMPQQKRDLHSRDFPAGLIAAVRRKVNYDAATEPPRKHAEGENHALEKRQGKAAGAGAGALGMATMLVPSLSTGTALAVGAGVLVTALYLHGIREQKLKAAQEEYNSKFHSAGEAASSVGNAISTGANGQLFNPITGNLILVDPNTNLYYDSGTGEQVNPKTGMPGGNDDDASSSSKQQQVQLPIDKNGNVSGDLPQVQQAMAKWNTMTPQQQQQLLAQYGDVANQILNSPDPNAALQAWSNKQAQASSLAVQQAQQQQQVAPQQQQSAPQHAAGAGFSAAGSGL